MNTPPGWSETAAGVGDPFENDDAAYVLGALGDDERAAFESHLASCDACAARVAALAPVHETLVAAVRAADESVIVALRGDSAADPPADAAADPAADPARADELLDGLVRRVERRRRRYRWTIGAMGTVAAAAVAALITVAAVAPRVETRPAAVFSGEMTAVSASNVSATASVNGTPWGSEITVSCSYTGGSAYQSDDVYTLEVVDLAGQSHTIGSWTLARTNQVQITGGIDLSPGQIRAVEVARADGPVVLRMAT